MATIVTRAGKGSALTHGEMDSNFSNINTDLIAKPDINVAQSWTAQQNFTEATLTDAATIAWDTDVAQVAKVTLEGNRTLGAPTNMNAGGTYILRILQDIVGSRTLAYNAVFKFSTGTTPVLTTTASAVDILSCISDGTNMYCSMLVDMK